MLLLTLLFVLFPKISYSQEASTAFQEAKEQAYLQQYEPAIETLLDLIATYPDNLDYPIFLARVYSWKKSYTKAIALLEPMMKNAPPEEALGLMIQVQLWATHYEEAIRYADLALSQDPNTPYRIQKAQALFELERLEESRELLSQILEKQARNQKALALQTQIFKSKKQELKVSYLNTSFSNPGFQPWHLASVGVKTHLGSVPVLVRGNYGRIFSREGFQAEIDAYPKVSRKSYLYLNAGSSINGSVFPDLRGGLEYFQAVSSSVNLSLGGKYMKFPETDILLYTGQFAYTFKNGTRLSYRPYLADIAQAWTLSHALSIRFAESLKENVLQVDLQYGTVPYEYFTSGTFTDLRTARAGIQYQFRLSGEILLQPLLMYEFEEYLPDQHRNRFNSQILATYRF